MRMRMEVFSAGERTQEFRRQNGAPEKVVFFEIVGMDSDFEEPITVAVRVYKGYEPLVGKIKRGDTLQIKQIMKVKDPNQYSRFSVINSQADDVEIVTAEKSAKMAVA